MYKRAGLRLVVLAVMGILVFCGSAVEAKYSGGTGEPNDPYLISDVNDIQEMRINPDDWGGCFSMTADIDLGGAGDNPDGSFSTAVIAPDADNSDWGFQGTAFGGVFDGNDFKITNMIIIDINDAGNDYLGLFGQIDINSQVMNLGLEDVNITGGNESYNVGGLCGRNFGTITNCYAMGNVIGGDYSENIGGLCGYNTTTITNCYAMGNVTGGDYSENIGGLCGYNSEDDDGDGEATISNCWATGSVTGGYDSRYVGGLVGHNYDGSVLNCYSTGSVNGEGRVGGLVGYNDDGIVSNCYSTGDVSGDGSVSDVSVGGLVGYNDGSISNCSSAGDVSGDVSVGGLVGNNDGSISNCSSAGDVSGDGTIGGLVGNNDGSISNCYSTGSVSGTGSYVGGLVGNNGSSVSNCYSTGDVSGDGTIGGLVGVNSSSSSSSVSNCYSTGFVSGVDSDGDVSVGGLVGENYGSVSNCYSTGETIGTGDLVGGLVGCNWKGSISNCYSTGDVSGAYNVGGLVGVNEASISNCYSTGDVSGGDVSGESCVGGLVGSNWSSVLNCYSAGDVNGTGDLVGGLVGENSYSYNSHGSVSNCFWDIDTQSHGVTDSIGYNSGTVINVAGLPTAEMQMESTFTDAGWDFDTPIWKIDDGNDYPRLWWENSIPVADGGPNQVAVESYSVVLDGSASTDADGDILTFSWRLISKPSGSIAEIVDVNSEQTSFIPDVQGEYTVGLVVSDGYFDSEEDEVNITVISLVDAIVAALGEAVDGISNLAPNTLKNSNMKNALMNKIDTVLGMIDKGQYKGALGKLENDILAKMDGCATDANEPDKNDWIRDCEEQEKIYPLVTETIEYVRRLMEEPFN